MSFKNKPIKLEWKSFYERLNLKKMFQFFIEILLENNKTFQPKTTVFVRNDKPSILEEDNSVVKKLLNTLKKDQQRWKIINDTRNSTKLPLKNPCFQIFFEDIITYSFNLSNFLHIKVFNIRKLFQKKSQQK